jgi:hypothetical protein
MLEPSPFFDPDAPASDLEEFLREIEGKLDGFVPAEHEHLLLARPARTDAEQRSAA